MDDIVRHLRQAAKQKHKTIALPENEDNRVRQAAETLEKEGIAKVLLFGRGMLDKDKKERYALAYYELRKAKGISLGDARIIVDEPLYYAAMMARLGEVDGFVAGAAHTTSDVARAAIQCLGVNEKFAIASSCFLMVIPNCPYGENGTFIFADCGIIPEPNARQLACIAVSNAELAKKLFNLNPKVALLSYSTKGSAKGKAVDKITEALKIAKEINPDILIDGELQADAAIIPEVAGIKDPDGLLQGRANVLIFPNLEAGNIGYKLVQRLANARAIGPLIVGLNKPCSDLSRGCLAEDIIDAVAVTAIMAQ